MFDLIFSHSNSLILDWYLKDEEIIALFIDIDKCLNFDDSFRLELDSVCEEIK